jgi:hypothetical protein
VPVPTVHTAPISGVVHEKVQVEFEVRAMPERVILAFLELESLRAWWRIERALVELAA